MVFRSAIMKGMTGSFPCLAILPILTVQGTEESLQGSPPMPLQARRAAVVGTGTTCRIEKIVDLKSIDIGHSSAMIAEQC